MENADLDTHALSWEKLSPGIKFLCRCVGDRDEMPQFGAPPLRIRSEMHSVLSTSYQLVCGVFRYPSVLSTIETAWTGIP